MVCSLDHSVFSLDFFGTQNFRDPLYFLCFFKFFPVFLGEAFFNTVQLGLREIKHFLPLTEGL